MEWINYLFSFTWWQYLVAVILGGIGYIGFIFYRGYNKVRPKPVKGIPCPAFTHPLLGHPEGMIHPIRHDIRSHFSENFPYRLYQLCLMNHNAIFANDPTIVAEVLTKCSNKGSIFSSYRYHQEYPDILASDGEAYEKRRKSLVSDLASVSFPFANNENSHPMTKDLLQRLEASAVDQDVIDLKKLFTLFSLDRVCEQYFSFDLQAVNGSAQGEALYESLRNIYDAGVSSNNLYDFPHLRKVTEVELSQAKDVWRQFLDTIYTHISDQAKAADHLPSYGSSLMTFQAQTNCHREEIINEIHLLLRHGSESIMGTCLWMCYVFTRNTQLRQQLEQAVSIHLETHSGLLSEETYPTYLECYLKELFRRYPVMGNMTVRTLSNQESLVLEGVEMPVDTPIHLHMYTMHNRERNWVKAKEFHPERWMEATGDEASDHSLMGNHPTCPFLTSNIYEGAGFEDHSLSYFPFSVGQRTCLGRSFVLSLLRRVLYDLIKNYRFTFAEESPDEDYGISVHTIIIPFSESSTRMRVQRIQTLGVLDVVKNGKKSRAKGETAEGKEDNGKGEEENDDGDDDGWADDNDFDDFKTNSI